MWPPPFHKSGPQTIYKFLLCLLQGQINSESDGWNWRMNPQNFWRFNFQNPKMRLSPYSEHSLEMIDSWILMDLEFWIRSLDFFRFVKAATVARNWPLGLLPPPSGRATGTSTIDQRKFTSTFAKEFFLDQPELWGICFSLLQSKILESPQPFRIKESK